MISGGDVLGDSQYAAYLPCELGCESRVPTADDLVGQSKSLKYMSNEEGSGLFRYDGLVTRDKEGGFSAIMVSDSQNGVVPLGRWQLCDKIYGNNFEWGCFWFREDWL